MLSFNKQQVRSTVERAARAKSAVPGAQETDMRGKGERLHGMRPSEAHDGSILSNLFAVYSPKSARSDDLDEARVNGDMRITFRESC